MYILCDLKFFFTTFSGLERAFSSFGLVHTKLRNRLGNERVMKLVRTYCHLRDKEADDDDSLELLENAFEDETDWEGEKLIDVSAAPCIIDWMAWEVKYGKV